MIAAPSPACRLTEPPHGETAVLQERVQACARLLELVALQLGAAAEQDGARAVALDQERVLATRAVCGAEAGPGAVGTPDPVWEVSRVLQHALDVLDGRSEEEQRLRDWIGALQDASLPLLRSLVVRPRPVARAG